MSKEFFLTVLRASERSFSWSSVPAKLPPPFNCVSECVFVLVGGWVGTGASSYITFRAGAYQIRGCTGVGGTHVHVHKLRIYRYVCLYTLRVTARASFLTHVHGFASCTQVHTLIGVLTILLGRRRCVALGGKAQSGEKGRVQQSQRSSGRRREARSRARRQRERESSMRMIVTCPQGAGLQRLF